ncbi:MAG: hypothetical protein P4K83_03075 [Terracidiphilus sp.]|nr:hypothetical protein [Terracidiphilus sp.]
MSASPGRLCMPRGQLRARILTLLRRGHQHRRLRSAGKDRGKFIPDMALIDDRPIEVEPRLVPDHGEGDLIKDKRNKSQMGALAERTTLYVATYTPAATRTVNRCLPGLSWSTSTPPVLTALTEPRVI